MARGTHLPPHKSSPRLEVYFRARAFLKASVTAILFRRLYPHKTQIILERDGEKMLKRLSISVVFVLGLVVLFTAGPAKAQLGNAGSIEGVVKDSSGGVVPGAKVEISYAVSGYQRETTTGSDGSFRFSNVPFNSYHLVVTTSGFAPY